MGVNYWRYSSPSYTVICHAFDLSSGDSHRRGALSHWKRHGSGRWFVDAKRVDSGTVTHLSLVCRIQITGFPGPFYWLFTVESLIELLLRPATLHNYEHLEYIEAIHIIDRHGAWCCVSCMSCGILHGVYDTMGDERICCMTVILVWEGIWIPLRFGVRVDWIQKADISFRDTTHM